ncbi:recombinase family protein [Candidatus Thioglobus sp.]|nr:recombinase family protein [Candidatus Thioglobus sp.]
MSKNKLYCYLRVSTQSQVDDGNSIENQRHLGQKISKSLDLEYVEMNEGGFSSMTERTDKDGKTIKLKRPVFEELKEGMRIGRIKNIWYFSRSRWTRSEEEDMFIRLRYFRKFNINVYEGETGNKRKFDSSQDRFLDSIFTSVQQLDREQRREVSISGKKHLSRVHGKSGVFMGGTINFGFKNVDKKWEIHEEESKYVKKIFQMYLQGISIKKIKIFLDSEGVKPRRSKTWNLHTILTMLKNRVYLGEYVWKDKESNEEFKIVLPRIIDHSLFNRVQKKIEKNIKQKGNNSRKFDCLLSDLLVCSCGQNITGRVRINKVRTQKLYGCRSSEQKWKGNGTNPCKNNRTMNMDNTDQLVVDRIKEVVGNSSILKEKFKKEVLDTKTIDSKKISQDKKKFEKMIKGLDQQIDTTIQSISVNWVNHELKKIDEKRFSGISTVLETELSQLEDSKKILIKQIDDLDNQKEWVDWISKYGEDISERFKKPTSKLLDGIIDNISVSPVMGETREGKETQRGHIFNIKFKLPIVNDGIEYKNEKKKSDGYSLVDGKKSTKTKELITMNGRPSKKKVDLKRYNPNSFNSY